jgi:hypothetical protein
MQCLAESYGICEILKGWFLVRAQKDYEDEDFPWKAGELALGRCNDPDFIFSCEPIKDPIFYMTKEQEDNYYNNLSSKEEKLIDDIYKKLVLLNNSLSCHPRVGYNLMSAAINAGYKKQEDFDFWLLQKMAEAVELYDREKDNLIVSSYEKVPSYENIK